MSIYVKMVDKFMSGWGRAECKTSLYVIECDTQAQADQIKRAAGYRSEMTRIKQVAHCPKSNGGNYVSVSHFNDLGEVWTSES